MLIEVIPVVIPVVISQRELFAIRQRIRSELRFNLVCK